MKKLFIKGISFFIVVNTLVFFLSLIIRSTGYHLDGGDIILDYQLNKIKNNKDINTAVFGGSSAGNAIDAVMFGNNTLNLSLVGDFNISGFLDMIKKTKFYQSDLDTVILLISADVFPRSGNLKNKFSGYSPIEVIRKASKIFFLKIFNRKFENLFINMNKIENDYLRQDPKVKNVERELVVDREISKENKDSISQIVEFCQRNKMEYLFLLGPNIKLKNNSKLRSIKMYFSKYKYNFSDSYYLISKKNIGDTNDHVHPNFKNESTLFYKRIIKSFFNQNDL